MRQIVISAVLAGSLVIGPGWSRGQTPEPNYDETKVPKYVLPDPLKRENGETVTDASTWTEARRPGNPRTVSGTHVRSFPGSSRGLRFDPFDRDDEALGGQAVRKQITAYFSSDKTGPAMDILIYLPKQMSPQPVPAFVGLNFGGNQAVHADPGIRLSRSWMRDGAAGVANHRATEATRGSEASRWQVEMVLARGYASGHDLLRRHRSRLRRRIPERRPPAVLCSRARPTGGRPVGLDCRLGLGTEPRAGLPRNRPGHRPPPAWP